MEKTMLNLATSQQVPLWLLPHFHDCNRLWTVIPRATKAPYWPLAERLEQQPLAQHIPMERCSFDSLKHAAPHVTRGPPLEDHLCTRVPRLETHLPMSTFQMAHNLCPLEVPPSLLAGGKTCQIHLSGQLHSVPTAILDYCRRLTMNMISLGSWCCNEMRHLVLGWPSPWPVHYWPDHLQNLLMNLG